MPKRAPWMSDRFTVQERYPPRSPRGIWRDLDTYSSREDAASDIAKRRASDKKQRAWEKENGYSPHENGEYRIRKH